MTACIHTRKWQLNLHTIGSLTHVWCIDDFRINLIHEVTHELTFGLTSMCHISPRNHQKKPTVWHKNAKIPGRSSSSPTHLYFPGFPPDFQVLCSPASRPKKRPFNTKPLGDKHCLRGLVGHGEDHRFATPKMGTTPGVSQNWGPI